MKTMPLLVTIKKMFFCRENSRNRLEDYLKENVAGFFPSYALSLNDEYFKPNERLIHLSLDAIKLAFEIDLTLNASLFPKDRSPQPDVLQYANIYPGEHYRLLAAIVNLLKPRLIIEIGTYRGLSALAMKTFLQPEAKIITYDIVPWDQISGTALQQNDFDAQLEQRVHDLTDESLQYTQIDTIEQADIIFVDAAKDFIMEKKFCTLFDKLIFRSPPIVIFDDIKMIPMVELWRRIPYPKIDMTSFGHWSGTGIVEWGGMLDNEESAE